MNIVIISDFAFVEGGASKVALSSARALAMSGHRVILFTAVGPIAPEIQHIEGLEVHCLHQHEILKDPNPTRAAAVGIWNWRSAEAFKVLLMKLSPESTVVHLHTWTKGHSASVIRVAERHGFQVVLTLHDYFSACPNGGFFLYPKQQICQLHPMSVECISTQCDSRNYAYKLWRVGRQFVQSHIGGIPSSIQHFISISDRSENILRPYLPTGALMHRIPNPINLERAAPCDPSSHDRFCFVGRLAPEKGPALLASCAAGGDLDVVFVGEGPERAHLIRVAPQVEITGWLPPEMVKQTMQTCRALVFPSLWYETQGLAVAEAAAIGLPTIVSSSTAAVEWVDDGVTGLIFEHGNAKDLSEKLRWMQSHGILAADMGLRAYQRYWNSPATMERHCQALEQVYSEMLAGCDDDATNRNSHA
ncbi:MAG: glycosyltransferase family 4 protein [Janthinobacterium lividum]